MDNARGVRFEVLARSKDGREWWLDTDAQPLFDSRGTLQGWVSIQTDVTEEVQKREATQRDQNRILTMIQGGNIGTWEWDTTGDWIETNRVYMTTLGYSPDATGHGLQRERDLVHDEVQIHRDPKPDGFGATERHGPGGHVQPAAFPDLTLPVRDLLG